MLTVDSTGGLIALGLAAKCWTVEECISHFERVCKKAFTRRAGANIPVVCWVVDNYHHWKYETGPLEEALMGSYSEDQYLFGGRRPFSAGVPSVQVNSKVAVTTTSAATGNTVLLTNYNRASTHARKFRPLSIFFWHGGLYRLTSNSGLSFPAAREARGRDEDMESVS